MDLPVDYPLCVLTPADVSLAPAYNNRPGQEATNGMRRSMGMAGSQFRLTLSGIATRGDIDKTRTLRALIANLEGDRNLIRIRLPDLYGIDGPWSIATKAARKANPLGIPFATDAMYATGVGHAVPKLEATFAEAAPLSSRFIYVKADQELPAGCAISIKEFCYMISGSWAEPDGRNRIKLSPPLRHDMAAGDVISLAPVFVGFCVTDTPGFEALRFGKFGSHTLEFVEDLTRLVEDVD